MIAIIDYGVGNLRSVQKALEKVGGDVCITQNKEDILKADKIVFPGVGAIKPAMDKLEILGLIPVVKEAIASGKPFLAICVGFQLLFETSEEGSDARGLGLIKGDVKRFKSLKIPQIGWNAITKTNDNPLFDGIKDGSHVYFCHSYYVDTPETDLITAQTEYGITYTSSICKDNIYGVQFHPEKSQMVGLKILNNFVNII
ncbi:MAG: glutamine amidotransferase [Candidatus Omnitrophota bacterium]|jgi:glutamine amidotransferase